MDIVFRFTIITTSWSLGNHIVVRCIDKKTKRHE